MAKDFVWAIDENGKPTKCVAKPENRGKRNCKHIFHAKNPQELNKFMKENGIETDFSIEDAEENEVQVDYISQEEVDEFARRLDEIAGERVTEENFREVLNRMTPEQIDQINKLGFEAAPAFSLPVSDEMYEEVNESNKIYFAELPSYHIGGKSKAITDMFGSIGPVPIQGGESDIKSGYRDGLTQREYFEKQFSARGSQIQKTVSVSAPGRAARVSFYGMADTEVINDCGGDHSGGILGCKAPGVCKKCAAKSGWKVEEGELVGSIISTHATEGLTQSSLNSIHISGKNKSKANWEVISDTLLGYSSSPIISNASSKAKTTAEARRMVFEGLKEEYKKADIDVDDYNVEMIAKKLTSYKRDESGGIRYVGEDELCDFPSMTVIGGHNNIFLQSELKYSYDKFTRPGVYENERNAVSEMMR